MSVSFLLETERLTLCELSLQDAGFILELLNEPSFLRFIGDRGVRTLDDALGYLTKGPIASYARNGFGLWRVQFKNTGEVIGICGLVKRDSLSGLDIGYAFLERFWSKGYATEAARAVKKYAMAPIGDESDSHGLGLQRLFAVIDPENLFSDRVLEKLGFRQNEGLVRLSAHGPELKMYVVQSM
ncbi:MAG: GNAT family N-acetyltransferase [Chloroflexota bacterium]